MKHYATRPAVFVPAGLLIVLAVSSVVVSHCEIPCGIYDDPMRIAMIAEHIQTIEKSMQQIRTLSEAKDRNDNQLIRWTMNKEDHADKLSEVVTQYFMTQRIVPTDKSDAKAYAEYVEKLTLLHQLMVDAMKCKQTTDLQIIERMRDTLARFKTAYLGPQSDADPGHSH